MLTTTCPTVIGFLIAVLPMGASAELCATTANQTMGAEAPYWQRLDEIRAERAYPADVEKGAFSDFHKVPGSDKTFHYTVHVPESYDPERKTDLHFYLHGGVSLSGSRITNVKLKRLRKLRIEDSISVYPSAWTTAKWWYESQSKNIVQIIHSLQKSYNIDENRVFIHGLSDGAGGAYYFASHRPTPFAGFIALVGSPHVLRAKHKVYGTTFPGNLVNKPIFAVNTRDDHWFPVDSVERLFEAVNEAGGDISFYPMPGDHFGMPWLGALEDDYQSFIDTKTRNPYPDYLYWQIDEGGEFKRIHWLIVNGTNGRDTESAVAAQKNENAVYLSAKNVSSVTLLISSDHFDLNNNIQVWSSNKLVFDQKLTPDVTVLDKWFRLDQDRSMLFANEICLDAL